MLALRAAAAAARCRAVRYQLLRQQPPRLAHGGGGGAWRGAGGATRLGPWATPPRAASRGAACAALADDGPLVRDDGLPPIPPPEDRVLPRRITAEDVEWRYARSSGPGGQNVNKVNTKADARLSLVGARSWCPEWVLARLEAMQRNKVNKDGDLCVQSDRYRTQAENAADCVRKLQQFLDDASRVPKEASADKKKKIANTKKRANERRLEGKKKNTDKKANRGRMRDY